MNVRLLSGFTLAAIAGLMMAASARSQQGTAAITVQEAKADPDFAVQGEYVGKSLGVQVVALGKGQFRVVLHRGGLPGAGWDGSQREVLEEDADGVADLIEELELRKIERKSPTLGATPPEGAVVLFDGTPQRFREHWQNGARMTNDGLLAEGATSVDTFQDFSLHLEFLLPYKPLARGQERGNSGVYYQGRYETQVLDSFGLDGKDNEAGAIYGIRAPDLNMCFPPLTWQTYDVDFTAARFDAQGKKTANARMTVRLNGVVVQRDVEVPRATRAAPWQEGPEPGPIYLQDHGNPVRFRNIWVLPRDEQREARRPIVPAFERFEVLVRRHGSPAARPKPKENRANKPLSAPARAASGVGSQHDHQLSGETLGRVLLGELNCVACHRADEPLARTLMTHPGPVLTHVGKRVQPDWLYRFIADPHTVKPGTTMPSVFATWSTEERKEVAAAIASFLATTGAPPPRRGPDRAAARRGRRLFHEIGCVACHQPRSTAAPTWSTSVPLPKFNEKYQYDSLAAFLRNPLKVRPAGRMPKFPLDNQQTADLAHYLMSTPALADQADNMRFATYSGHWEKLPDFEKLTPERSGTCAALDLGVAGKTSDFAVRYDGYLHLPKDGEYRFFLGSDDGSRLFIDGQKIVDVDGAHPHQVRAATRRLSAGAHAVRVDYFQAGGEWTLTFEYQGPGIPRQDAFYAIGLTDDPASVPRSAGADDKGRAKGRFTPDPSLAQRGRELFATVGCANCHELKVDGKPLQSRLRAKPLRQLNLAAGCLATPTAAGDADTSQRSESAPRVPNYDLNVAQRAVLRATIASAAGSAVGNETAGDRASVVSAQRISHVMAAFNCYACHSRGGIGGPEPQRNESFAGTIQEMGDEGRIPPPLDGVGDKLNAAWLKHVLSSGADDRPYMLTAMPQFRIPDPEALTAAFVAEDAVTSPIHVVFDESPLRVKSTGRVLVGERALGCVKCHTFGPHRATGIQAMDLQKMTRRLRENWFHRYLPNPQRYRPGTRMPSGFPDGKSTVRNVFDGQPQKQIAAIWAFLSDGPKAAIPDGVIAQMIELVPKNEPIIYRNFIEGLSPRGIAVGYPERCHLAWDADRFCLALVWHGRFIDAGKHWQTRGAGSQRPLGDHIVTWEATVPIAPLESPAQPWPTSPPKQRGYRFRGYRLNGQGQPTFLYEMPRARVSDFPQPVARGDEGTFSRSIVIEAPAVNGQAAHTTEDQVTAPLYFRAAVGRTIETRGAGHYFVDKTVEVRIRGGGAPVVRDSDGRQEVLVPLDLSSGRTELVQEIVW